MRVPRRLVLLSICAAIAVSIVAVLAWRDDESDSREDGLVGETEKAAPELAEPLPKKTARRQGDPGITRYILREVRENYFQLGWLDENDVWHDAPGTKPVYRDPHMHVISGVPPWYLHEQEEWRKQRERKEKSRK